MTGPTSNVQSDIPQAERLFRLSGTPHAQVTALQPAHELQDTEHGDAICPQLCDQIWVAFDIIVPTHLRVAPHLTVEVGNPPNATSVNVMIFIFLSAQMRTSTYHMCHVHSIGVDVKPFCAQNCSHQKLHT